MFNEGDYEEDEGEVNEVDDRENREQAADWRAQDIRNALCVCIFQGCRSNVRVPIEFSQSN